jgi:hypothetical protein
LRFNVKGGVNSIFAPTRGECSVAKYALYMEVTDEKTKKTSIQQVPKDHNL